MAGSKDLLGGLEGLGGRPKGLKAGQVAVQLPLLLRHL